MGPERYMDTILLVDDNPLRAAMRQSVLEAGSATVVRALDASEALCLVESPQFAQRLTLTITGHTMTGISGPEFVAELRSRIPHMPVLVLSPSNGSEQEYAGIPDVYHSHSKSPDELRATVASLVGMVHKQSA